MELQLLITHHMKNSVQHKKLCQKLHHQSVQCLELIHKSSQNVSRQTMKARQQHCLKKVNHFETYFAAYLKQFVEKGEEICNNQFTNLEINSYQHSQNHHNKIDNDNNPETFKANVKQLVKKQNQCIQFYMKSKIIFQENCNDKLKSLVQGLSFQQL